MKKCPQCEFIYEDDQSLCDMDGVLLVFDTRTLPNAHALATVSAPIPGKTARRNRMVPAFATLVVMVAVASVYYVSTMRNAASTNFSPASVTSTSVEAPAPVVVPPAPTPAEVETPKEEPRETHAAPDARPASPPAQPSSAAARPAAPPPNRKATTTTPATPKAEPKKEDSKVESILKKTGKLIKKPFKF